MQFASLNSLVPNKDAKTSHLSQGLQQTIFNNDLEKGLFCNVLQIWSCSMIKYKQQLTIKEGQLEKVKDFARWTLTRENDNFYAAKQKYYLLSCKIISSFATKDTSAIGN